MVDPHDKLASLLEPAAVSWADDREAHRRVPQAPLTTDRVAVVSQAISLKRIADALEQRAAQNPLIGEIDLRPGETLREAFDRGERITPLKAQRAEAGWLHPADNARLEVGYGTLIEVERGVSAGSIIEKIPFGDAIEWSLYGPSTFPLKLKASIIAWRVVNLDPDNTLGHDLEGLDPPPQPFIADGKRVVKL